MKILGLIWGLVTLFVTLPIQFYLLYSLLKRTDASELMWFLFWIQVPLVILMSIIGKIVESNK